MVLKEFSYHHSHIVMELDVGLWCESVLIIFHKKRYLSCNNAFKNTVFFFFIKSHHIKCAGAFHTLNMQAPSIHRIFKMQQRIQKHRIFFPLRDTTYEMCRRFPYTKTFFFSNNRKTWVKRPKGPRMHGLFFYLKGKLVILLYLKKLKA
jgi:hypothetical protein